MGRQPTVCHGAGGAAPAPWPRTALAALAIAALPTLPAAAQEQAAPSPAPTSSGFTLLPSSPLSPGINPSTGPRVPALRLGTLGFPIGIAERQDLQARGWAITPSLGVELLATDNVFLSSRDRRADLLTTLTPGLLLQADTARAQGVLSYNPMAQFYASTPGQDRLDHFLNTQALVTLMPERLFVDIRGAMGVQSLTGGLAGDSNPVVDRRDRVQTTSLQVSPYALFRFEGLGAAQVGYAFQYVDQEAGGNGFGGAGGTRLPLDDADTSFFTAGEFTAHEGFIVLRTGEELGRLSLQSRLSATTYQGSGVLDGAWRRIAVVEGSYAVTPMVAALADLGYEQQRYSGPQPLEVDSPVWAVGVRLTGPESTLTLKYGQRDGFQSVSAQGSIALGGRTRLAVLYSERQTTLSQRLAEQVSTTTLDRTGTPVDPLTGVPVLPPSTRSLLSTQGGVQRIRTTSVALSQTWPRDTLTLAVTHEEREPVSPDPGTNTFSQSGTSATLSWVRQLGPVTSGSAFVQYGVTDSGARGDSDVFSAGIGFAHELSQDLTATLQYRLTTRNDDGFGTGGDDRAVQNLILIGLRKTF